MNRRKACLLMAAAPAAAAQLPAHDESPWLGSSYWANPLQDWRLRDGAMECHIAGGDRNVFLLTHEIAAASGSFEMRAKLGRLAGANEPLTEGFAGFRVGVRGHFNDYRDSAIYGTGLDAGVAADGRLFIGKLEDNAPRAAQPLTEVELLLTAEPAGANYKLRLQGGAASVEREVPAAWLPGGVALVCHSGVMRETPDPAQAPITFQGVNKRDTERGGSMRFWFRDWRINGSKIAVHEDRAFGPILFTMYTVNRGVMKLTAQMAPLAETSEPARLQVRRGAAWRTIASAPVDALARTATFRVSKWDQSKDAAYRVAFRFGKEHYFEGSIRRDPVDKAKVTVAGLSCNNDLGFPHADVLRNLRHFEPDLIALTGDQIYERVAGYGIERFPTERATLDYLRKWYLVGWEYRDLLREIPCVCLPDDHDVYHGNVWGAGGRRAEGQGQAAQDSGGYIEPAEWVNMVQRTQTSHMPDPFDPAPVEQNISVYYTSLLVGGVSFAIIEDRKWKSAPKQVLPDAKIINGWAQNPAHKGSDGDVAGAQLLGPRQMKFLNEWAADWSGGAWMKSVISQTIFANVATLPAPANTDAVTSKLPILPEGGYGQGELKVADHDSNAWPQTPRNEALRAMRRCFAFHIAGDQHLGSTIQYGVDEFNDAAWAICVPAIANIFPRRWYPAEPGANRKTGAARNSGEYLDGFGNKVTIHAVFNPQAVEQAPRQLHQRAPGYGIIEFGRATRKITVTNWPRWVDATAPGAKPCPGWPITIDQTDNGMPRRGLALETVTAREDGAIVQVIDQASGEALYTYRLPGRTFTPTVFRPGKYTVKLMDARGKVFSTRRDREPAGAI